MPRKTASQWEFGELFSPRETRRVLTVSELTANVRRLVEEQIGTVWIGGEVTNLRAQASGHIYFSLKDETSQLNCVLFRGTAVGGRQLLDNGLKVIVQGELTVYEVRGQYQLVVQTLEFQGVGALQVAFEKLKRELDAAGYFAPERKRSLPAFPGRLGLVTSPTGAAIRDVLHVIRRRHPALEVVLRPCRVQGEGAAGEIATAIRELNEWSLTRGAGALDLLLVTRGGGSLEDLWAFNERPVADAIFSSALPVVSAVGHEIDFTISDFVADFRAATPSAAAEIITEAGHASRSFIADARHAIHRRTRQRLEFCAGEAGELRSRLLRASPLRRLRDQMQFVDELRSRSVRQARVALRALVSAMQLTRERFLRNHPAERVHHLVAQLDHAGRRIRNVVSSRIAIEHERFARAGAQLRLLSPRHTLLRGYAIVTGAGGRIVRSAAEVKAGDPLDIQVSDGRIAGTVVKTSSDA